mgnify:FL=1
MDQVCWVDMDGAVGESIPITRYDRSLGGKGLNQAEAARRAGCVDVNFMGCIGDDVFGDWVLMELKKRGFDTQNFQIKAGVFTGHVVIQHEGTSGSKMFYYGGANDHISLSMVQDFLSAAMTGDIFVCQNEVSGAADFIKHAYELKMKICFNPSPSIPKDDTIYAMCEWVFINEHEYEHYKRLFKSGDDLDDLVGLKKAMGCRHLIVTFGKDPVLGADDLNTVYTINVPKRQIVDTVGAGDCLVGYFVASVAKGQSFKQALESAVLAASIKVTRHGAFDGIPYIEDLS